MKNTYSETILATYATFKELYNSKKYSSPYQILSEFIKYTISTKSLYTFTLVEIQGHLKDDFGFNPPIAVIRTALKSIPEVKLDHQIYKTKRLQSDGPFRTYRQQAEAKSEEINNSLIQYCEQRGDIKLDKQKLSQELIAFLLDEDGDPRYQQVIGSFILANENNKAMSEAISTIREGSILYSGLAFNISEFGSLNQPITLFLDTEILFDLMGLNGSVYKNLADDFMNLVQEANHNGRAITLKYFSKVEEDIDQFYYRAERIVSGQGEINFSQAMKSIVSGCQNISDVSDKKTEFYRKLRSDYSINKDEKENYYTDSDNAYNLEGSNLHEYPETDEVNREGYQFCSHINKLRKGKQVADCLSSRYLCVTDTRRVLEISRALAENEKNLVTGERYCDYAVSLSYITNLLWYKLNRGFGSTEFPKNLDVVIKARTILTGYITQGIALSYKDIRSKAASGELTEEQVAARVVALRGKTILPEELTTDTAEDALCFKEEYFARYEEMLAQKNRTLLERDRTIELLSEAKSRLQEELAQVDVQNREKEQQIEILTERVNAIEEQEQIKIQKRNIMRARFKLCGAIAWKVVLIIGILIGLYQICILLKEDFPTWLGVIIGAIGIGGLMLRPIKRDWQKYKREIE